MAPRGQLLRLSCRWALVCSIITIGLTAMLVVAVPALHAAAMVTEAEAQHAVLAQAEGFVRKYNSTHSGSSFSDVYVKCAHRISATAWLCADSWRYTTTTESLAGDNIVCGFPVTVVIVAGFTATRQDAKTECLDFTTDLPVS